MPNSLKIDEDQRFFEDSLNRCDVVVHGRMSYEGQANSPRRKRIILTRKVAATAPDPANPNSDLLESGGRVLRGGRQGDRRRLRHGRHPRRAGRLQPVSQDGLRRLLHVPCAGCDASGRRTGLAEQRQGKTAEQVLEAAGLKSGPVRFSAARHAHRVDAPGWLDPRGPIAKTAKDPPWSVSLRWYRPAPRNRRGSYT